MALAIVTLVFNVILVIQHYVLYMGNIPLEALDESRRLLVESSRSSKYYSVDVNSDPDEIFGDEGGSKAILLTTSRESIS